MPIFPKIMCEQTVRVGDKTRLDATGCFKTPDLVDDFNEILINPDEAGDFDVEDVTIPKKWYLDWAYSAAGDFNVVVSASVGNDTETATATITVLAAADDVHLSTDQDLMAIDADIMKYVKNGRNSHLDVHREVTNKILDEIYKNKIVADDQTKLTIDEVVDVNELKEWAKYYALEMIYASISNVPEDIFDQKAKKYSAKKTENMNLSMNVLKLDYDKSGTLTTSEMADYRSSVVMKR